MGLSSSPVPRRVPISKGRTVTESAIDADIAGWLAKTSPDGEPTNIEESRARTRRIHELALEHMNPALLPESEVDDVIDGG